MRYYKLIDRWKPDIFIDGHIVPLISFNQIVFDLALVNERECQIALVVYAIAD